MIEQAEEKRVVMELIYIPKCILNAARFKFYAIADRMYAVFAKTKQGIHDLIRKNPKDLQLYLFKYVGFAWS